MEWRRTTWLLFVMAAVAACGGGTQYRNVKNPAASEAQLTQDMMDCRNQSLVTTPGRFGGEYDRAVAVVDDGMLTQCLSERGWQAVSR
jgi:hypothetical protein